MPPVSQVETLQEPDNFDVPPLARDYFKMGKGLPATHDVKPGPTSHSSLTHTREGGAMKIRESRSQDLAENSARLRKVQGSS